ncbi:inner centromere protein A-like [Lytechinus variegatus]|uniref:inner centromere protein A-like n=1 Tax=Lytechinus variegatus TaxID=7654 RepID=UPI001BB2109C|nr:inner centromere protein A-like [Lytechinus variegatus]XP_041481930.1 inner centromere protein A-like [Lytechinus variegatus]
MVASASKPFNNSVAPLSMYANADDSDSDSSDDEFTSPVRPRRPRSSDDEFTSPVRPRRPRQGFQEVQFTMAEEPKETSDEAAKADETPEEPKAAPVPVAKLTVPITELPKPNECSTEQDTRTTNEIIKDFRDTGLVAGVGGGNVRPKGVAFDIHFDTVRVRPKTAKGVRVPKAPRRLERLELPAKGEGEKIANKIKEKQEKAARKRQAIHESRLQKKKEKDDKKKRAVQFVADADEQKKQAAAQKIALKAERVKSARLSQLQDRQRKVEMKSQKHQKVLDAIAAADEQKKNDLAEKIASKAERVKSARLSSTQERKAKVAATKRHRDSVRRRCECQNCPDPDYDKISTYNGSSNNSSRSGSRCSDTGSLKSGELPPSYFKTSSCLVSVDQDEQYDDFFDKPVGEGAEE